MRKHTQFSGVALTAPNGARIAIPPSGTVTSSAGTGLTPGGVAFGPLDVRPSPSGPLGLTDLRYAGDEDALESLADRLGIGDGDGLLTMGAVGAVATTDPDDDDAADREVSRRDALKLAGIAVGGLALTSQPVTAKETVTIATFDIETNPGVRLRILDKVAGLLPPDKEYEIYQGDNIVARFDARGAATLPRGVTGEFTLATEPPDTGMFTSLRSWFHDDTLTFKLDLPTAADTLEPETTHVLTTDPTIIEAVSAAGPGNTILEFRPSEVSVPHRSEQYGHSNGQWWLRAAESGRELVYQAGPEPPPESELRLAVWVTQVSETIDDYSRLKPW